jgi:hypothetical protein
MLGILCPGGVGGRRATDMNYFYCPHGNGFIIYDLQVRLEDVGLVIVIEEECSGDREDAKED